AVVVKNWDKTEQKPSNNSSYVRDLRVNIDGDKPPQENSIRAKLSHHKWKSFSNSNNSKRGGSQSRKWSKNMYYDILDIDGNSLQKLPEKEEAVGIITMEDVIEELLQVLNSLR
ncbi:hypothetical protein VIGAN_05028800, partial [Vigna angularis var. angularis]